MKFDFREYPMQLIDEHLNIEFEISGTTMCNSEGELLFSCNGDEIFDASNNIMDNGDGIFSEITTLGKSVVISPNSKYAYFFANGKYYRYDLTEEDIPNSEELISDWTPFYQNGVIPVIPWASQLGSDGKIYIASQSTVSYMDVMHDPDMNSIENCRLEQRGLELPNRNNGTIANHPNYRLGPIDGSSCDTLGLDNLPVANFRYEVFTDTVLFRDLSAGAPNNWFWTFGDGAATNGQHQNKIYSGGLYEVCLTVSNENGSDTWCDSV